MNDNRPIGVFDSGVGGLTVAKQIQQILPNESIIYFGDTKHLPYGDKSPETIKQYSTSITDFLLSQNCKAIVVACNTASSNALKEVQKTAKNKAIVVDVIQPVAHKVAFELHQKIGVIATKATVSTGIYKKQIKKLNQHIQVTELATPLLVPIIEEGLTKTEILKSTINHYLTNKKLDGVDAIILGCTHYPIIQKQVQAHYNQHVKVVDSPLIVTNYLFNQLQKKHLLAAANNQAVYQFFLSDYTKNFNNLAKKMFGNTISLQQKVLS